MPHTSFSKEDYIAFRDNDRDGPIHMLNLIRLREKAEYQDGRQATGAEAYAAYGRESEDVYRRVGGRIVWRGAFEQMLIGPRDEHWDVSFIAEYPSVAAFIEMVKDPIYRAATEHRQAAASDSRLIRLAPMANGLNFADPSDA